MLHVRSSQLGQAGPQTGLPALDRFLSTPSGKIITAGMIGVGAAKAFPNRAIGGFAIGAILGIMFGLVPEVSFSK